MAVSPKPVREVSRLKMNILRISMQKIKLRHTGPLGKGVSKTAHFASIKQLNSGTEVYTNKTKTPSVESLLLFCVQKNYYANSGMLQLFCLLSNIRLSSLLFELNFIFSFVIQQQFSCYFRFAFSWMWGRSSAINTQGIHSATHFPENTFFVFFCNRLYIL